MMNDVVSKPKLKQHCYYTALFLAGDPFFPGTKFHQNIIFLKIFIFLPVGIPEKHKTLTIIKWYNLFIMMKNKSDKIGFLTRYIASYISYL